jgi:uncharacterized protein
MEFVGYLAIIGLGLVLSMIGGGGSLLSVPILVYLFSIDIVIASSYSLFIVGTTSLFGAALKYREYGTDLPAGIIFGGSSALAVFVTRKWILPCIPDEVFLGSACLLSKRALIMAVFAMLVIASSLSILLKHDWRSTVVQKRKLKLLLPVGLPTGMLAGFVGAGGGVIILPALISFGRLPFKIAVGTTLLIISFNSLIGFLADVTNDSINWIFLLLITMFAIVGMIIGNFYHTKIPLNYLRLSLGWMMLVTAIAILFKEMI